MQEEVSLIIGVDRSIHLSRLYRASIRSIPRSLRLLFFLAALALLSVGTAPAMADSVTPSTLPEAPGSPPAQALQPPYWQRFEVGIDLQPNGDFLVTEDQVVVFGATSARRGFREIPLDRVEEIRDISVAEPDRVYRRGTGSPYTFQVERTEEGFLRIDWWFPPTANASRNFIVSYRVVGGLRYYPGGDQLYWKAIYADRPYPVQSGQVVVRFPFDLPADQVKSAAYPEELGVEGNLVDRRTVLFQTRGLPAGTGLEVRVQFPHGLVSGQPPSWQAAADRLDWYNDNLRPVLNLFLGALGLLTLLMGFLWVLLAWHRRGRDPLVGSVPPILSEPPGDLPPGVAGTLVDQRADVRDAMATLVDLARRGVLRIIEEHRGQWAQDFRLELLEERPQGLREYEQTILNSLFAGGRTARFSRLGSRFREAIPRVQSQLYQEAVRAGLFPESPEAVRRRYRTIGIGLALMGAGLAFLLGMLLGSYLEAVWAPFGALALVGLGLVAAASHMPRRTEIGTLAAARWAAFARYLAEGKPKEELAAHLEAFEPYLPYAIAFGSDRRWVRRFAAAGAPAPRWYEVERPPVFFPYGPGPVWGGPWGFPSGHRPPADRVPEAGPSGPQGLPSLQELSDQGAFNLQQMSDSLAGMLNRASEVLAQGGGGGWTGRGGRGGGGGGWSGGGFGGGGGGGGGRGGFG